jgi:hypothetical protein
MDAVAGKTQGMEFGTQIQNFTGGEEIKKGADLDVPNGRPGSMGSLPTAGLCVPWVSRSPSGSGHWRD